MLFIDNPVGAGFSYTGTGKGSVATTVIISILTRSYELTFIIACVPTFSSLAFETPQYQFSCFYFYTTVRLD